MNVKILPIPGTTKIENAASNFLASSIELSDSDMEALEKLSDNVVGLRGDEGYIKMGIESQQ